MAIDVKNAKDVADGFRMRMVLGEWWVYLYKNNKYIGAAFGPHIHKDAVEVGKLTGLTDLDRLSGRGDRP